MQESLLNLGDAATMVASLCQPAESRADFAVLLFNAGVIPRMGPHRLWVKMARELAQHGITTLRFDLSGQGDSQVSRSEGGQFLDFETQAVHDIRQLMDAMQRQLGIAKFVMVGICSGAAISYKASLQDTRIVACAMLDVYMYPTQKTRWNRFKMQAHQSGWASLMKSLLLRRAKALALMLGWRSKDAKLEVPSAIPGLLKPTKTEFSAGLQSLLDRGLPLLMIYTGSFMFHYNYAAQFEDGFKQFKIRGPLVIEFTKEIDHTLTALSAQTYFIQRIRRWLLEAKLN